MSENISSHIKQLSTIIKMLEEFKIRIEYQLPTKDELFDYIFKNSSYKSFKECNLASTRLTSEEKELICSFYSQLGTTDLQGQLSMIEIYKKDFSNQLSKLSDNKDNKCRLLRTGGLLTGIFICLLLI